MPMARTESTRPASMLAPPLQPAALDPELARATQESDDPLRRFLPAEFAAKLDAARKTGAMVGERRIVTMLFCDVTGSTAAAEQLDPEEWTEVMNGAFEHMIGPVYAYEGTVARLSGDAILAFFGAPIAHEDDPQRAVLAGLDILAAIAQYRQEVWEGRGLDVNVRVGINTGLVVVGAVGSDLRMEYTAMGDAINLAARMEQSAGPGTLQIAQATYELVAAHFEIEPLPPVTLKGKSEPAPAYRVRRRRQAVAATRGLQGLPSILVGREREVAALRGLADDTRRGLGRLLFIVGDAGLGKSRLVSELREQWTGGNDRWLTSASYSYEKSDPYAVFKRLIRRMHVVVPGDEPGAIRARLAESVALLPADLQERADRAFAALFGLALEDEAVLSGESFREALYTTIAAFWRVRLAAEPCIVVFEDMHWADQASLDLLAYLLQESAGRPPALVCTLRPDRHTPAWALMRRLTEADDGRAAMMELPLLTPDESSAMIDGLLSQPELPAAVRRGIVERSGGNPFFTEEIVRGLLQSGAIAPYEDTANGTTRYRWQGAGNGAGPAAAGISSSLQALLAARVDLLDAELRQTLQYAAVIGRSFHQRHLAAMHPALSEADLDDQLGRLVLSRMLSEVARLPEQVFAFRNPLTQEVVYDGILLKQRRQLHQLAAEALEQLFPQQRADFASLLAQHFALAGMAARAVDYYRVAGDAAGRLFANLEALEHYSRALALAADAGAEIGLLIELYRCRGRVLELLNRYEEAVGNYQEMMEEARRLDAPQMELAAVLGLATVHNIASPVHDSSLGRRFTEEAIALAQRLDDQETAARVHWSMMLNSMWGSADYQDARSHGEAALALARAHDLFDLLPFVLNDLALANTGLADLPPAIAAALEAIEHSRAQGNTPMQTTALQNLGSSYVLRADFHLAEETLAECIALARSTDNLWSEAAALTSLSLMHYVRGDVERALREAETALRLSRQISLPLLEGACRMLQGEIYVAAGLTEQALIFLEDASALRASASDPQSGLSDALLYWVWAARANARAASGDAAGAGEAIAAALALDSETYPLMLPIVIPVTGRLHLGSAMLALGDGGRGEVVVDRLLAFVLEHELRLFRPAAYLLHARLHLQQGRMVEAHAGLLRACQDAEELGTQGVYYQSLISLSEWEQSAGNAVGDSVRAAHYRAEAAAVVARMADGLSDEAMREEFLNRPEIRPLLEHS